MGATAGAAEGAAVGATDEAVCAAECCAAVADERDCAAGRCVVDACAADGAAGDAAGAGAAVAAGAAADCFGCFSSPAALAVAARAHISLCRHHLYSHSTNHRTIYAKLLVPLRRDAAVQTPLWLQAQVARWTAAREALQTKPVRRQLTRAQDAEVTSPQAVTRSRAGGRGTGEARSSKPHNTGPAAASQAGPEDTGSKTGVCVYVAVGAGEGVALLHAAAGANIGGCAAACCDGRGRRMLRC